MIYAIIGLGVAGITAAKTIRNLDKNAEIHIFTDEVSLYYPRPKLFDVIAGEVKAKDLYYYDSSWYEENRINLHLGLGVRKINKSEKTLLLELGAAFKYDKLLISNGAWPFMPEIKGIRTPGVMKLRNLDDAFKIRRHSFMIGNGKPVTIIGGGLLGLEAAHSLRKNKLVPTIIENSPYLLSKQLDKEGGDILKGIFENEGIHVKVDSKTAKIIGEENVEKVILENGEIIKSEMVLVSTGVKPASELLERSGLPINKGALVNEYMQLDEDIYAAGDIAEYKGRVYGIIPPSIEQAKIAAENIVKGNNKKYEGSLPYNTLKVAGIDFTSIGDVNSEMKDKECSVFRAKIPLEGKYRKIVAKNGKIIGIILLGIKGETVHANKLVQNAVDITPYIDKLSNINFSLKEISL